MERSLYNITLDTVYVHLSKNYKTTTSKYNILIIPLSNYVLSNTLLWLQSVFEDIYITPRLWEGGSITDKQLLAWVVYYVISQYLGDTHQC